MSCKSHLISALEFSKMCPENEISRKHCWSAWTSEMLDFDPKSDQSIYLVRRCAYCNTEEKA